MLVGEPAVVEDLEEQVPDWPRGLVELVEQHDRERVLADRGHERRPIGVDARVREQTIEAVGLWNSLMSRRTSRSAEPNRNSASAFAISVFPVPVGPTNRKTPSGRVGSVTPALIIAMRSTTASTASSCPRTRRAKNSRVSSSRSGIEASSISSGNPLDRLSAATRSVCPISACPLVAASTVAVRTRRRRFPGDEIRGRNCSASSCAPRRVSSVAVTS